MLWRTITGAVLLMAFGGLCLIPGLVAAETRTPESVRRWQKQKALSQTDASDTVGACAVDAKGSVASATSTGGLGLEIPGRVSDSAMPAGNYSNALAAVSATGIWEEIIDECLAAKIVFRVTDGMMLAAAFEQSFKEAQNAKHRLGAIGITRQAQAYSKSTSPLSQDVTAFFRIFISFNN